MAEPESSAEQLADTLGILPLDGWASLLSLDEMGPHAIVADELDEFVLGVLDD